MVPRGPGMCANGGTCLLPSAGCGTVSRVTSYKTSTFLLLPSPVPIYPAPGARQRNQDVRCQGGDSVVPVPGPAMSCHVPSCCSIDLYRAHSGNTDHTFAVIVQLEDEFPFCSITITIQQPPDVIFRLGWPHYIVHDCQFKYHELALIDL